MHGEPPNNEELKQMQKWDEPLRLLTINQLISIVALCIVRGKIDHPTAMIKALLKHDKHSG